MSTVQSPAGIVIPAFAADENATKAPAVSNLFYVIEFYRDLSRPSSIVDL